MERDKPNFILGCFIAPLAAPLIIALIIIFSGVDWRDPSYKYNYGFKDAVGLLYIVGYYVFIGAPFAYAVTLVVGLPFYFVTEKYGYINFWSITFGAAFVAIFPCLLLSAPKNFFLYDDPIISSFLFYLSFAISGYVVGLVFWFVSGLHRFSAYKKREQLPRTLP
jgi:hypothetical protein